MIEIKELQPNISSPVEGLQPSLEGASFETEIATVSPNQEINPTVEVESSDVKEIQPQVQNLPTGVNTFKERAFDVNAPIADGRTWLSILQAKKLREELPQ